MTTRPPDVTTASHAARLASEAAAASTAETRRLVEEAAVAETVRLASVEREAGRMAFQEGRGALYLEPADAFMVQKITTSAGLIELAKAIGQNERALYAAFEDPQMSSTDRMLGKTFCDRLVHSHPSARLLRWLSPLLAG